ncbi:MAG: hypothetical protein JWM53_3981 [bacterium]|nr:hypothetical protein [bacterium]
MNRSMWMILSLGLLASTPALAQQPLQPAPVYPPNGNEGYTQPAQPQYDPNAQPQQVQQPQDPYAQYGDVDDEDDGLDVSYDISTSPEQQQEAQYDDGYDPNAYQQFESQLAPYGAWQDVPSYGRVWMPSASVVGYDFTPYASGGHWVMSDYGWTWVSDWDWGWAPFHYGRWMVVGGRGWCWIPGTHWGPAWVNWRWGGGYVGWAPMGPRGVVVGPPRGIRSPWHFTVAGQLGAVRPHYLPSQAVASVWRGTTAIHNVSSINVRGAQVRFNAGPSSHLVAAATGRAIAPMPLHTIAPRALPNQAITPRAGIPLQQRPWMQPRALGGTFARTVPGSRTLGGPSAFTSRPGSTMIQGRPQPLQYRAPVQQPYRSYTPPSAAYRGAYAQPQYRYNAPAQTYRPAPQYNAPMQTYRPAPQYRYNAPAPQYRYNAPAAQYHYNAPAPSYHYNAPTQSFHSAPAPSFHSAPTQSFHSSGGFSGGGGFHGGFSGGGARGGGRR